MSYTMYMPDRRGLPLTLEEMEAMRERWRSWATEVEWKEGFLGPGSFYAQDSKGEFMICAATGSSNFWKALFIGRRCYYLSIGPHHGRIPETWPVNEEIFNIAAHRYAELHP